MAVRQYTSEEQAALWIKRFSAWDRNYQQWEDKFLCRQLEDYFEGFQWEGDNEVVPQLRRYVINLFFSSIEAKIPTVTFVRPVYNLTPRPDKSDFDQNYAYEKSKLQSDVLNSFVLDRRNRFSELVEECAYDAFFRFAAVEIGYDADWKTNPKAGQPVVKEDGQSDPDNPEVLVQPEEIPENERVYVNRINPRSFRVGGRISRYVERCGFVAYFEYIPTALLKSDASIPEETREKIGSAKGRIEYASADYVSDAAQFFGEDVALTQVWRVWSTDEKQFYLVDGESGYTLKTYKYKRLPVHLFAPVPRMAKESAYPVPVVFNWLGPQNELNETREAVRAHRRRFSRKYVVERGVFSDIKEFQKFVNGPDGTVIESETDPNKGIAPVPNAEMDSSALQTGQTSKDDFNVISATSSEQRGQADRTTATQANIVDARSKQRENRAMAIYMRFLNDVGESILHAHEKIVNPMWVKRFVDSPMTLGSEFPKLMFTWQQILSDEVAGEDFDVIIDITALSDEANEAEKKKLFELLAVMREYPELSFSPVMITEVMNRLNYNNSAVRNQILQMATMRAIGATQMMEQQSQMGQQQMAKSTPNTQEKVTQQLKNQVGGGTQ